MSYIDAMIFLQEVYNLTEKGEDAEEDCLDHIFRTIDSLFTDGNFIEVDRILSCISLNKITVTEMLGFLTITSSAKDQLPTRVSLYDDIKKNLELCETPDRVEALLRGLE